MLPTLDARLAAAAELVRPGQPVADIGCDHGKLTAVLAASGRYPKVIGAETPASTMLPTSPADNTERPSPSLSSARS